MDFRKWVLVLAVLALAIAPAAAQVCTPAAGTPTFVRGEGLAELVGDLTIDCQGGSVAAGTIITPNITLSFNTYATSKLINSTGNWTEALLILDEAGAAQAPFLGGPTKPPVVGNNVFEGQLVTNPGFVLQWPAVPIEVPPANSTRRLRFTNLRVDANPLLATTSTFAIGQVTATVGFQGSQPWTIPSPTAVVGQVVAGVSVDLRNGDGTAAASKTFQQCVSNSSSLASSSSGTAAAFDFRVRFTEGFLSSFKVIGGPGQLVPGVQYFTESGLLGSFATGTYPGAPASSAVIGQAMQGTRLFAKFAGIPAGVTIYVSAANVDGTAGLSAVWIGQDATAYGTGAAAVAGTTGITGTAAGAALAPVTLVAAGDGTYTGTAVWEITGSNSGIIDKAQFGVVVAYTANTSSNLPALTVTNAGTKPATAGGGFAPVSTVVSSIAGVPRFVDTSAQNPLFNIAACVTNLLFPFVTNQAGFDTGIALVNTSQASPAFTNATQHGTCTVYYFGQMAGGGALPAAQTTADIPAGNYVAFNLNGGGVPGATSSAQGFQGYVIARCAFQYAHGYAFISNLGVAVGNPSNFAQGYLALVIPDRGRVADPFSTAGSGTGEQLVQ